MNCSACGTAVDPSQRFCPKCGALVGQDPTAPDPLIGTKIGGKYQIVKLLGEGGMGSVYEGEQSLGTKVRRVAIKTLHPHLSKDPKVLTRFQREVGTLSELDHPNTIQVFDFGSTAEGQLYIVMEFVQGPALADVLAKGGAIEPDRAEKILAQICGSLEEAHAHGIIHRDLKPENVVLTERAGKKDFVKVLDFGIAKRGGEEDKNEQKLTQQGMVLGTPPYMSPEQFTGKPIDARSDVYALGVMAYEMLTGTLPFKAESAWEWATQHMTVPPIAMDSTPQGKRVPERMRLAITRALAKNPDDRWPGVKEFFDAFSGVSGAAAIGAAGPVRPARLVRRRSWRRRRPTLRRSVRWRHRSTRRAWRPRRERIRHQVPVARRTRPPHKDTGVQPAFRKRRRAPTAAVVEVAGFSSRSLVWSASEASSSSCSH
jgi:serine/threonine protein kinase